MNKYRIPVMLFLWALSLPCAVFAANAAEGVKSLFLRGEYRSCADAGSRLLDSGAKGDDELWYVTGLSCLKSGDPAGAVKAFEALLRDFRRSRHADEARVGIADAAYLSGDTRRARSLYASFLVSRPGSKLRAGAYYRLYLLEKREGNARPAQQFRDKIRLEFPHSPEAAMERDIFPEQSQAPSAATALLIPAEDLNRIPRNRYSIQIGAFSKKANAQTLANRLKARGYPAYVEEVIINGTKQIFKVKVGQMDDIEQARALVRKLARDGYPTRLDSQ